MDALEVLEGRRSVRNYSDKPVDKEIIKKIINVARFAPTANNKQPWEFVVVTDSRMKSQIAGITEYGKFIAQAGACIVVYCQDTKYYLEDGSAATQNILLAAHALGIGSCWVAGDKKDYCKEISELLGVPGEYKLVSLIAIGYADRPVPPHSKRSLEEVLHWEKF